MDLTIFPTVLHGAITPPPSKSQAHRLIIAAALAHGESVLSNVADSQDMAATIACMEELGAEFVPEGSALTVRGAEASCRSPLRRLALPHLDCGESGSTLRFLIPVALAVRGGGVFSGRGRLMERPQEPYLRLFEEKGISYGRQNGGLTVSGRLAPGEFRLAGNVSSQFITGLLFALPLLEGDSTIVLTSPLESGDYVAMTLDALAQAGIRVERQQGGFFVPGRQRYAPIRARVESDWSQAGFWYAAAGIGNRVTVEGMNRDSIQGDRVILDWGRMLSGQCPDGGATVPVLGRESGTAQKPISPPADGQPGRAVSIDVSHSPDLVPPLAAWGALMNGTLYVKNAARLRMKESDRLAAVTAVLSAMGARIAEGADCLTIEGAPTLAGGVTVSSFNDHRIAMMAAIAATRCRQPVTVTGAECVAKSYPGFWDDYRALGGRVTRRDGD